MKSLGTAILCLLAMAAAADRRGAFDDAYFAQAPAGDWTPKSVAGLALWLDASQLTQYGNEEEVEQWYDYSGNNNTVLNAYYGYPSGIFYVSSAQGGKPSIRFDNYGFFNITDSESLTISNCISVFIVSQVSEYVDYNTSPVLAKYIAAPSRGYVIYFHNVWSLDPQYYVWPLAAGHVHWPSWAENTWYYTTLVTTPSGDYTRLNGVLEESATHVDMTNAPAGEFYVGTFPTDPDNSIHQFWGYISEILVYNNGVSTSDRDKIEGYLKNKYGL